MTGSDGRPDVLTAIRSILFAVAFYGTTAIMAVAGLPVFLFFSERLSMDYVQAWARVSMFVLRWTAGVRIEVRGRENVPAGAALVASKHQSALETFALLPMLPFPAVVMKRELKFIPLFGWYSVSIGMIHVDRGGGASALRELSQRSRQEAARGRQIVIFPEGTRRPPGAPPDYQGGVALLYKSLKLPVVPVALNSGLYWPRRSLLRYPGTVVIEFLPAIEPGLDMKTFLARLKDAIETASDRLLAETATSADPPPLPAVARERIAGMAR